MHIMSTPFCIYSIWSLIMDYKTYRKQINKTMAKSRIPCDGFFELTGRCNLDCRMCYIHYGSNDHFFTDEKDGDWWIQRIDEAYQSGLMFALLTGGECMLHPDFERIYLHLRELGVYTRVNTNGLLLTDQRIEFFKRYPPIEIQVTLYGSDDEHYKQVTGHSVFSSVDSALKKLKDNDLRFIVAITPCKYTFDDLRNMISYLRLHQYPFYGSGYIFEANKNTGRTIEEYNLSVDKMVLYEEMLYGKKYDPIPYDELPPAGGSTREQKFGITCTAGHSAYLITWDGFLQPCTSHQSIRVKCDSFSNAWNELTKIADQYRLPVECEGCAFISVCKKCVAYRTQGAEPGHCNPYVCELTKRLISAGVLPFHLETTN